MRIGMLLVAAVLSGLSARAAATSQTRTVPCSESIGSTRFPFVGDRYRPVLGVVSVPPAYLRRVVPTHSLPWAYWRKAGLIVRASGEAVTIDVPRAWQRRAAIVWGNGDSGVSSLRLAGCKSQPSVGNTYAGGFYLRARSACVPLIFGVGARRKTVKFGVGRTCP
jgi:hypothetical protein